MADYDFSTLNSTDLEELVCDLLNAQEGEDSPVRYQTYKEGKDQGVDFLYSTETNLYEHIGQVKHYYRTGFASMFHVLKNEEVEKVKRLNPHHYIFATSVDLSFKEAFRIHQTFQPFIKSLNDIYGKKNLNRLIELHDDVLARHYKLWFSDTSILEKILNSDLQFRSSDFEGELKKRIRFYVKTPLFDVVRENLKTNNFIVITGDPGVGKTTLAEMLTYEYIKEGYELLVINDEIKEIERILRNDDSKQIFYFDDFLGSNSVQINKAQGSESALLRIIGRIKRMVNKKLIFTTRSIILKTMIHSTDKFARFSRSLNEKVFQLNEYSEDIKEKLLTNHIEESEMNANLKSVFNNKDLFTFIVTHSNFNPRSVEFITANENIEGFTPHQYENFIVENFNNPSEIWRFAYEHQIDQLDRWLLNTLLTFDGKVEQDILEQAFYKRIECCPTDVNSIPVHPFLRALEKLDKGFIVRKKRLVDFINPSLKDFLMNFVGTDPIEISKMLNSIKYVNQLSNLFLSLINKNHIVVSEDFKTNVIKNYGDYIRPKYIDHDLIHLAIIINNFIKDESKTTILIKIVSEIRDWEALHDNYELNLLFKGFIDSTKGNKRVSRALIARTESIVNELFCGEYNLENAVDLLEDLKETFELDFSIFNTYTLERHLHDLFNDHISTELGNMKDYIIDVSEVGEFRNHMNNLNDQIKFLGIDFEADMKDFNCDWEDIGRMNDLQYKMQKDD